MKYEIQYAPVLYRSSGDHDIRRFSSLEPRIDEGPTAAKTLSRLDFKISECEGRLGSGEGLRSGS